MQGIWRISAAVSPPQDISARLALRPGRRQVQLKEVLRRVAVPPEKAAQQRDFVAK